MLHSPDLLVITDDDIAFEVEKGYYPNLKKAVQNNNLLIIGYEEWQKHSEIQIKGKPLFDGEDVFILNPYSNCYIKASDNELLDIFCEDKSLVVKETLVKMGAKHIIVVDEVSDKDSRIVKVKGGISSVGNPAGGSLTTSFSRIQSVDVKSSIESHDPYRIAKSPNEVLAFINQHGLAGDTKLKLLYERLLSDGKLSGKENYTLAYLNEVDYALSILAKIDYKVFSSSLDFSIEHNHIHKISRSLSVEF